MSIKSVTTTGATERTDGGNTPTANLESLNSSAPPTSTTPFRWSRLPKCLGNPYNDPGFGRKVKNPLVDRGFNQPLPSKNPLVDRGFGIPTCQAPKAAPVKPSWAGLPLWPNVAPAATSQVSPNQVTPSASSVYVTPAQQLAEKSVVQVNGASGVVVAQNGNQYVLLTNEHCIKSDQRQVAAPVSITLPNGEVVFGTVIARGNRQKTNQHDLAVVQFTSDSQLQVAKISKNEPAPNDDMFAIGFPFEGPYTQPWKGMRVDPISGKTVAEGKVLKTLPDGQQVRGNYGVVSTSGAIQGMSGGGAFNAQGELIGISGQSAIAVTPPRVEGGKSFAETLGPGAKSLAISVQEISQFFKLNEKSIPDWARASIPKASSSDPADASPPSTRQPSLPQSPRHP